FFASHRQGYHSRQTLPLEKIALAFNAPAIAGKTAIIAHHAVAWDRDGDLVGGAGLRHSPHRFRSADAFGNFGVTHCFTDRNFSQGLPDPLLECGSLQVERQVETDAWRFDEAHHFGHHVLEIAVRADEIGLRKAAFQIADQLFRVVAHQNRADTPVARSHEYRAERRLADGETDIRILATLL